MSADMGGGGEWTWMDERVWCMYRCMCKHCVDDERNEYRRDFGV